MQQGCCRHIWCNQVVGLVEALWWLRCELCRDCPFSPHVYAYSTRQKPVHYVLDGLRRPVDELSQAYFVNGSLLIGLNTLFDSAQRLAAGASRGMPTIDSRSVRILRDWYILGRTWAGETLRAQIWPIQTSDVLFDQCFEWESGVSEHSLDRVNDSHW